MDIITPVKTEIVEFTATDGRLLTGSYYQPVSSNGRSVLINGATAVKRSFYERYAIYLAEQGFSVLTYDYRGIGDSLRGPVKLDPASFRDWGEKDTVAAIDLLESRAPTHQLSVVGHSAGGQLFGLAANNGKIGALLTVSSQSGYWRLWPSPKRWLLATLWYGVMPGLARAYSYFPASRLGLGGTDLPRGVALEWARCCRHPDYLVDLQGRPLRRHFKTYPGHVLGHVISDDWMAPSAAVAALLAFYENAQVAQRTLTPEDAGVTSLGHFGYFREKSRSIWTEACKWLQTH